MASILSNSEGWGCLKKECITGDLDDSNAL